MKLTKLFSLSLVASTLLFGDFSEQQNENNEVKELIKEYTKYKDKVQQEMEDYKNPKPKEQSKPKITNDEYQDLELEISSKKENKKTASVSKPDINEVTQLIDVNETIENSDAWTYIQRWFILADQVDPTDENTIFYLIYDSEFDSKLANIEELSMDKNFIPDDKLISLLRNQQLKYIEYLKGLIDDLGDIDSKFYKTLDFEVKAKGGLNIRANPLTGLELSRTTNVASAKSIRVKYFISGSGKNFNGNFVEKWAKVEVSTKDGRILGWANMKYLKKK